MRVSCLLPDRSGLRCERVTVGSDVITVEVSSCGQTARCPKCGWPSSRVHSRYVRTLDDLPWQGRKVQLRWRSRRFFCDVTECTQRIFTERLPSVAGKHARATDRLSTAHTCIAMVCGGESGARLAQRLGMSTSPDHLLRLLRRLTLPAPPTPRVLGIDDWALRRGQRYGTILCDLERHKPIDLLPERSTQSVLAWLAEHPGVQIISRDRGDEYRKAATEGAPQATQVADRWHLLHNLHEAMVRVADGHQRDILAAGKQVQAKTRPAPEPPASPSVSPAVPARLTKAEQLKVESRQRRWLRYQRVLKLHRQGVSLRAIARELGISRRTVRRFIDAGHFPERATPSRRSQVDPYAAYLRRRWEEGCHSAAQLTREIQGQGFTAGYNTVGRCVAGWRDPKEAGHTRGPRPAAPPSRIKRPSSARVAWVLFKDAADLEPAEVTLRETLLASCDELKTTSVLAHEFVAMVAQRRVENLDAWISLADETSVPNDLRGFAVGLTKDIAAVRAALTLPWSNGQVEGQINRLKLVKRQMYGRAKFDLLRLRFLHAG